MVICPDCGKEVKDAKFCSNCGSRLPEIIDGAFAEKTDESVDAEVVEDVADTPVEEVEDAAEEISEEKTDNAVDAEVVEDVADTPVEEVEAIEDAAEEVSEEKDAVEDVNIVKKSKFCPNCGKEVSSETVFCPKCGFRLIGEEKPQTKFCQNCGKKIDINAEICPHCGVRVANRPASEEKNVLLSAILSFVFPGLGHLYLGLNMKGISFIVAYIVSVILIFLLIGIVLVIIVWLWALIDAIKSTEAINKGEHVEDKLF
ncbi:zinc-ribbon domain-containing protein [Methanobrevibacter sp.]